MSYTIPMGTFIGTKTINAGHMTLGAYNQYRGWDMPANEDPNKPGYLVEYSDGGKSNHPNHTGYISWSPAEVFEKAYQQSGKLSFGHALVALEQGQRVARAGWNGKGMWLAMQVSDEHSKMTLPYIYIEYPEGHPAYPKGSRVPWLASQTDMLAKDWVIL